MTIFSSMVGMAITLPLHALPLNHLSTLAQKTPTTAIQFYNRGVDKLESGNYQDAIADFTQAISRNSKDADTFYNRGYAYHVMGDFAKAIKDYTKAITLRPNFANAFGNRGYAHYLLKNYPQTIADCTE
ncbi:MAG TPA: tetratricopeptide repeat protein, partial [Allocoleopsis sp.]